MLVSSQPNSTYLDLLERYNAAIMTYVSPDSIRNRYRQDKSENETSENDLLLNADNATEEAEKKIRKFRDTIEHASMIITRDVLAADELFERHAKSAKEREAETNRRLYTEQYPSNSAGAKLLQKKRQLELMEAERERKQERLGEMERDLEQISDIPGFGLPRKPHYTSDYAGNRNLLRSGSGAAIPTSTHNAFSLIAEEIERAMAKTSKGKGNGKNSSDEVEDHGVVELNQAYKTITRLQKSLKKEQENNDNALRRVRTIMGAVEHMHINLLSHANQAKGYKDMADKTMEENVKLKKKNWIRRVTCWMCFSNHSVR